MTRAGIVSLGVALLLGSPGPGTAFAHPWDQQDWHGCPGYTHGPRHGATSPYYGRNPDYTPKTTVPIGLNEAKAAFEDYISSTKNPNLRLDKIKEQNGRFSAEVTTKEGSLVDRLELDRATGYIRSVYR